ncbi:MAG: hypothetical protein DMF49_07830 [Acidobacteria bacterium]|nr:MAG: hypothetical protein DMF49_07830 [Acidobacteriota bacterium]
MVRLMPSFGERLKCEREAKNRTIEEIGVATGIQLSYLEALEKNEFHTLPGRAFGKLYIRACAEILGLDPQPLIDHYDREQHQQRRATIEPPPPEPERPRRVEAVIADWREAKMAGRNKPPRAEASLEVQRERADETRREQIHDVPAEKPHEEAPPTRPALGSGSDAAGIEREAPGEHDTATVVVPLTEASRRTPNKASSSSRPVVAALAMCGLLLIAMGVYFAIFRTGSHVNVLSSSVPSAQGAPDSNRTSVEPPHESSAEQTSQPPAVRAFPRPAPGPVESATEPAAEPPAAPFPRKLPAGATAQTGWLTVPEFGLGRRIVNRRLEGQDERFDVGVVVLFSTRVLGGKRGKHIRHVWLHEGRAVQSIALQLRGPDWRTYSRKTIRDVGQWAVEARDEQGRVLARETFISVPAGT